MPGGLFAACAADPGDGLKILGEAPIAGATSVATIEGTPSSMGQTTGSAAISTGTATGTSSSTAQTSSSSNGQTSLDASTTDAGGGDLDSSTGSADGDGSSGPVIQAAPQCAPPTATAPATWPASGLPLTPANYYSGLANGGYAYPYSDVSSGVGGGTSTICQEASALCAAGTTGIQSAATWGAGVGLNLSQTQGGTAPVGSYAVPTSATGITYALTALPAPQTVYLTIDNGGTDYYAPLTAASGHVAWSGFRTTPWAPATSVVLGKAPTTATHVEFQIQAGAASSNFSFCVTSLSFE